MFCLKNYILMKAAFPWLISSSLPDQLLKARAIFISQHRHHLFAPHPKTSDGQPPCYSETFNAILVASLRTPQHCPFSTTSVTVDHAYFQTLLSFGSSTHSKFTSHFISSSHFSGFCSPRKNEHTTTVSVNIYLCSPLN